MLFIFLKGFSKFADTTEALASVRSPSCVHLQAVLAHLSHLSVSTTVGALALHLPNRSLDALPRRSHVSPPRTAQATAAIEGKLSKGLKKFIKKSIVDQEIQDELAVADAKVMT